MPLQFVTDRMKGVPTNNLGKGTRRLGFIILCHSSETMPSCLVPFNAPTKDEIEQNNFNSGYPCQSLMDGLTNWYRTQTDPGTFKLDSFRRKNKSISPLLCSYSGVLYDWEILSDSGSCSIE